MFYTVAQKVNIYLGNFSGTKYHQKLSKIPQSGHTSRKSKISLRTRMDDYLVTILSGKSAKADDKFKKVSAFFVTFEVTDSTEDGRQLGQH